MLHKAIFPATCNATNIVLQVARKVELSSTFRNIARQVAVCNMSSATCNVFHYKVVLQVAVKIALCNMALS